MVQDLSSSCCSWRCRPSGCRASRSEPACSSQPGRHERRCYAGPMPKHRCAMEDRRSDSCSVALLLFGAKRLPEIGRSLGTGMREFKDSVTGERTRSRRSSELPPPAATPQDNDCTLPPSLSAKPKTSPKELYEGACRVAWATAKRKHLSSSISTSSARGSSSSSARSWSDV